MNTTPKVFFVSDAVFQYDFSPHAFFLSTQKIGIVTAMWNLDITLELKKGAKQALHNAGVKPSNVVCIDVPGAFELPLGALKLIKQSHCDAVVALGCVIQGDTPHFDYVCEGATQGIMSVMIQFHKPIGFGLITTLDYQQAVDRTGGKHGHKGVEAADTVLQQLISYQNL